MTVDELLLELAKIKGEYGGQTPIDIDYGGVLLPVSEVLDFSIEDEVQVIIS